MELNISSIIVEKRKEKGITQQDLADFIGVSKASVSKWETSQTYPDITVLPLLAAYFDISIDELLNYDIQLSAKEIQQIYLSLQKSLGTTSSEEILDSIRNLTKRYYSCYPFVFQMGQFIINHFDLLPGENREKKIDIYMKEVRRLFLHVKNNSKDSKLIEKALVFEAYALLALQEADNVLEVLGRTTPIYYPTESLIAMALQMEGDIDAAEEVMQSAIIQNGSISLNLFTNYIPILYSNPDKFAESYEKGVAIINIYDMENTSPLTTLNFWVVSIFGFAQIMNEDKLLEALERCINIIKREDVPVNLQGNEYFNKVDKWIEELDLGNQLPRNPLQIKEDLVEIIIENPFMSQYKNNERFTSIFEELEKLQQKETNK